MAFKENRRIKITEQPGAYLIGERRPAIKLQGKWLEDFFQIGEYVNIQCDQANNRLIITKATE